MRLDNICRKLIEEALIGNMQAIKLVLDRILPAKRDRAIDVKLPKLQTSDDARRIPHGKLMPPEGYLIKYS